MDDRRRSIERWDAVSGEKLASIAAEVAEFTELLYAHDAPWVTAKEDGLLLRVDPGSNTVAATIETSPGAHGIAGDAVAVWITNYRANTVSRVDPSTNEVAATVRGPLWGNQARPRDREPGVAKKAITRRRPSGG